ncbi:MAG TPA: pilin [Candidatus Saccharimonadales bacterium]|nr:pilin [Candidatus Saccharimonadales bacterium]
MFKTVQKSILTTGAALALLFAPAILAPAVASAANDPNQISNCLSQGTNLDTGNGTTCTAGDTTSGTQKIQDIVTLVVNLFSIVVGIIAVIMIVVGGFKYITSGGDSGNITSAKNTIVYAVIGLVVVALAQFIVKFVLNKVATAGTGGA